MAPWRWCSCSAGGAIGGPGPDQQLERPRTAPDSHAPRSSLLHAPSPRPQSSAHPPPATVEPGGPAGPAGDPQPGAGSSRGRPRCPDGRRAGETGHAGPVRRASSWPLRGDGGWRGPAGPGGADPAGNLEPRWEHQRHPTGAPRPHLPGGGLHRPLPCPVALPGRHRAHLRHQHQHQPGRARCGRPSPLLAGHPARCSGGLPLVPASRRRLQRGPARWQRAEHAAGPQLEGRPLAAQCGDPERAVAGRQRAGHCHLQLWTPHRGGHL